ncbi:MAG: efflux transporter periplasmic adaptor subunit, partial [Burkholderiales bacterium]|nr:efflux transporter periplasmic adaptor subunit [Burkholderiales bacterium]
MQRRSLLALSIVLAFSLSACNKGGKAPDSASASASAAAAANDKPLLITAEDLTTVQSNALASGPVITGSVQPERKADLRAELSAVVLQVLKENGEAVRRGDLLVRLDDTSVRDS